MALALMVVLASGPARPCGPFQGVLGPSDSEACPGGLRLGTAMVSEAGSRRPPKHRPGKVTVSSAAAAVRDSPGTTGGRGRALLQVTLDSLLETASGSQCYGGWALLDGKRAAGGSLSPVTRTVRSESRSR